MLNYAASRHELNNVTVVYSAIVLRVLLTLTASRMRMALAKSFSLRHALRADSTIFGSGTKS